MSDKIKYSDNHASCLVCGHLKPFQVWWADEPNAGVCKDCYALRAETAALRAELEKVKAERDALSQWKESALAVESSWNPQIIAQLLGIKLGSDIRAEIGPAVERLRQRVGELETLLQTCTKWFQDIADHDRSQGRSHCAFMADAARRQINTTEKTK